MTDMPKIPLEILREYYDSVSRDAWKENDNISTFDEFLKRYRSDPDYFEGNIDEFVSDAVSRYDGKVMAKPLADFLAEWAICDNYGVRWAEAEYIDDRNITHGAIAVRYECDGCSEYPNSHIFLYTDGVILNAGDSRTGEQ